MSQETLELDRRVRTAVTRSFLDAGRAPSCAELARAVELPIAEVETSLARLADAHGIVLHPGTHDIWVAHPFATFPTGYWVRCGERGWWGNCTWCSLGIAALAAEDGTILTRYGGEDRECRIEISRGALAAPRAVVHFLMPAARWWDNVLFTCATILTFQDERDVDAWCARHGYSKGAVVPLATVWRLAQRWYGDQASSGWRRKSADEAHAIFEELGLSGGFWRLDRHWR